MYIYICMYTCLSDLNNGFYLYPCKSIHLLPTYLSLKEFRVQWIHPANSTPYPVQSSWRRIFFLHFAPLQLEWRQTDCSHSVRRCKADIHIVVFEVHTHFSRARRVTSCHTAVSLSPISNHVMKYLGMSTQYCQCHHGPRPPPLESNNQKHPERHTWFFEPMGQLESVHVNGARHALCPLVT